MRTSKRLKLSLIREYININNINITELAEKSGYARPYVSSVINQSRQASDGFLNHLLDILKINYEEEVKKIQNLKNLMNDARTSLAYTDETYLQNYNKLTNHKIEDIPFLLKEEYDLTIALFNLIDGEVIQITNLKNKKLSTLYLLVLTLNYFNLNNFNKSLEYLNKINDKRLYPIILYLKSYIHLHNSDYILSNNSITKAETELIDQNNYYRFLDLQILKMKLYSLNNKFLKAKSIYKNLTPYVQAFQSLNNKLMNEWFKILIINNKYEDAYSYKSHISSMDQECSLLYSYLQSLSNIQFNNFKPNNKYEVNFFRLLMLEKEPKDLKAFENLISFFNNTKTSYLFLEIIIKNIIIKKLQELRRYKKISELSEK